MHDSEHGTGLKESSGDPTPNGPAMGDAAAGHETAGTTEDYGLGTSPSKLLAITAVSAFVAELLIMFVLAGLPHLSLFSGALLDAFLVTVLLFPVLFFLMFRPMVSHVEQCRRAEAALRKLNRELESRVAERTAELEVANADLMREIADRDRAEREAQKGRDFVLNIVEASPDLVFLLDVQEMRCLFMNGRSMDLLGVDPEEVYLMGSGFLERFWTEPHLKSEAVSGPIAQLADGEVLCRSVRIADSQGKEKEFFMRLVVFDRSEDGLPSVLLCSATDRKAPLETPAG
jgi:PAS domain-containing protein